MIIYDKKAFGLNLLFRVHGSAVYRSCFTSLLSMLCFFLFRIMQGKDRIVEDGRIEGGLLLHPYAVGVLVSSTTFLIVFRANQGYSRYWEAASATHHMMSKWMDATQQTGVYHMQCSHYDHIKPPSYFDHPDLNKKFLTRARERELINGGAPGSSPSSAADGTTMSLSKEKKEKKKRDDDVRKTHATRKSITNIPSSRRSFLRARFDEDDHADSSIPRRLKGNARLDGNWSRLYNDGTATYFDEVSILHSTELPSFASHEGGRTPSLFLQELMHLSSLMCAVALATLRNDIDGSMSPLGIHEPGSPWPEVDSDNIENFSQESWYKWIRIRLMYLLGFAKSPEERTHYNAARPLPVLGGVSDNEILFLQMARGPWAKTQLCWNWLSEFIVREHLAGSLGKVGPPIVSRIFQFLSDGMIFYNHARKIMFIPFPFPHAQLSTLFIFISIPIIAGLMVEYADSDFVGYSLCFLATLCLSGIHEVARELENPFRNIPNELPVATFMAQFNEALITTCVGYHPDSYWEPGRYRDSKTTQTATASIDP